MITQPPIRRAICAGRRAVRTSVSSLVVAFAAAGAQAQTSITFDEVPGGTVIDSAYPGVVFSSSLGGHVYAAASWNAASPSNTVGITTSPFYDYFSGRYGAVDVTFSQPQMWASIDVSAYWRLEDFGTPVARPFIEAYDGNGALVARTYFQGALPPGPGTTPYETMRVAMPSATIKRIRFSVQTGTWPPIYGFFDNLRYSPTACGWKVTRFGAC